MSARCQSCGTRLGDGYDDGVVCGMCSMAHAAGYASAVADVVAWLERPRCCKTVEGLVQRIKSGAHVGAAKKGVSNG